MENSAFEKPFGYVCRLLECEQHWSHHVKGHVKLHQMLCRLLSEVTVALERCKHFQEKNGVFSYLLRACLDDVTTTPILLQCCGLDTGEVEPPTKPPGVPGVLQISPPEAPEKENLPGRFFFPVSL